MTITWKEETRVLNELKPFDHNPRRISKSGYQKLLKSLRERGYGDRIKINLDNTIAAGHQRLKALRELGYGQIEVLVPSRMLSEIEFRRELIGDNIEYGEYDFDILANHFEVGELLEFGFEPEELGAFDETPAETNSETSETKVPCKECPYKPE